MAVEDHESMTMQWLKELYKPALRDLQDRQQELEASTWQVKELCHEHDEAKQLQDANVARMAELEGENQHFSE